MTKRSDLTASGTKVREIVQNWEQYCDGEPFVFVPEEREYTAIPSLIQAEDYRSQSGTMLEETEDLGGGENVGFIEPNDILIYDIDVPNSGFYTIDYRLASLENGSSFDVFIGGELVDSVSSGATGGYQNWETVSTTVSLIEGEQTVRIVATGSGWNINWINFLEGGDQTEEIPEEILESVVDVQEEEVFVPIPSLIQAEDYSTQSGVLLEDTTDSGLGQNVGFIDVDDSLYYNIDVPTQGDYTIEFRLASRVNGANFDIYENNVLIGIVSSNATGGYQDWETVVETVTLSEGPQTLRIVATGSGWNINWLNIIAGVQQEVVIVEEIVEEEPVEEVVIEEVIEETIVEEVEEEIVEETVVDVIEEEVIVEETVTTNCGNVAEWSPEVIYAEADTRVLFEGVLYENKWYTFNQSPADFSEFPWSLWTVLGPCELTNSNTLSREINNNGVGVSAFPNPFNDIVTVSSTTSNQIIGSLQLVDLSGRIITRVEGDTISGLGSLSGGLYMLQVFDILGEIITVKKIVKN